MGPRKALVNFGVSSRNNKWQGCWGILGFAASERVGNGLDNIEKFNFAAINILGNLYKTHPIPKNGEELAGLSHTIQLVWDACAGTQEPREEMYSFACVIEDTLEWLNHEGFVRCEVMQGHRYPVKVHLTGAGLATIRKISPSKKRWQFWKREQSFSAHVDELFKKNDTSGIQELARLALDTFQIIAGMKELP